MDQSPISNKPVHFANTSPQDSPMSDGDYNNGEMLRISPEDTIVFVKSLESENEKLGTVEITNTSKTDLTYKIKTTSPEKFRVRPSTGVLAPNASASINVVLQQGQQLSATSKDKFLVMCMNLPDFVDSSNNQAIADLWKTTPSDSPLIEQHRLRCVGYQSAQAGIGIKNGRLHSNSGYGGDTNEKQISHFSEKLCQLTEQNKRLEKQLKFTQSLQWITLIVFLLFSVALVYILKQDIVEQGMEVCTKNSEL